MYLIGLAKPFFLQFQGKSLQVKFDVFFEQLDVSLAGKKQSR